MSVLQRLHFLAPDGQLVPQLSHSNTPYKLALLELEKHYENNMKMDSLNQAKYVQFLYTKY